MPLGALSLTLKEVAERLEMTGKSHDRNLARSLKRSAKKLSYDPPRRLDRKEMLSIKEAFPYIRDVLSEANTSEDMDFATNVRSEVQYLGLSLEVQ